MRRDRMQAILADPFAGYRKCWHRMWGLLRGIVLATPVIVRILDVGDHG